MQLNWLQEEASALSESFPAKMVLFDCETTGGSAKYHRIIEVGLIVIENGKIVETWQSFCDPERPLPTTIQTLTGISPANLCGAPLFSDIADKLLRFLTERVLVAHNARFDYGFLKAEFARAGMKYSTKPLCSVKFSRLMYPQFPRHGLSQIIKRFNFDIKNRHRALDDAKVIYDFFLESSVLLGSEEISSACKSIMQTSTLPATLNAGEIDKLPNRPGVYYFRDRKGKLLYVGKSVNIKARVLSHFSQDSRTTNDRRINSQIATIEFDRTPSDFGAQLLESTQIKLLEPLYNRRLKRAKQLFQFQQNNDFRGYGKLEVIPLCSQQEVSGVGLFRSPRQAKEALLKLADEYSLCHQLLGLEKTTRKLESKPCFRTQLNKCRGACCGDEPVVEYNDRFNLAIAKYQLKIWPWDSAILVEERDANDNEHCVFHLIDRWCYLSKINNDQELYDAGYVPKVGRLPLEESFNQDVRHVQHPMDLDIYFILIRFLLQPSKLLLNNLKIVVLEPYREGQ